MPEFFANTKTEIHEESGLVKMKVLIDLTISPALAQVLSDELQATLDSPTPLLEDYKTVNLFCLVGWLLAMADNPKEYAGQGAKLLKDAVRQIRSGADAAS